MAVSVDNGRVRNIHSICILFAVASNFVACGGIGNQRNALPFFSLSAASIVDDCHWQEFKQNISPQLQSQCIACHDRSGSGNLILSTLNTDDAMAENYTTLSQYIETVDVIMAEETTLMKRISSGSSSTHPLKFSSSTNANITFSNYVQRFISDPSCTGDTSGGF
jgi:hypothetical protein